MPKPLPKTTPQRPRATLAERNAPGRATIEAEILLARVRATWEPTSSAPIEVDPEVADDEPPAAPSTVGSLLSTVARALTAPRVLPAPVHHPEPTAQPTLGAFLHAVAKAADRALRTETGGGSYICGICGLRYAPGGRVMDRRRGTCSSTQALRRL